MLYDLRSKKLECVLWVMLIRLRSYHFCPSFCSEAESWFLHVAVIQYSLTQQYWGMMTVHGELKDTHTHTHRDKHVKQNTECKPFNYFI